VGKWFCVHIGTSRLHLRQYQPAKEVAPSIPSKRALMRSSGVIAGMVRISEHSLGMLSEGSSDPWLRLGPPGAFVWEFDKLVVFPTPIPYPGQLGVWWVSTGVSKIIMDLLNPLTSDSSSILPDADVLDSSSPEGGGSGADSGNPSLTATAWSTVASEGDRESRLRAESSSSRASASGSSDPDAVRPTLASVAGEAHFKIVLAHDSGEEVLELRVSDLMNIQRQLRRLEEELKLAAVSRATSSAMLVPPSEAHDVEAEGEEELVGPSLHQLVRLVSQHPELSKHIADLVCSSQGLDPSPPEP
jgi:hypothetical protein